MTDIFLRLAHYTIYNVSVLCYDVFGVKIRLFLLEVMMKKITVVIWGYGAMGKGIAEMLLKKKGVEITGVCDTHPKLVGKSFLAPLDYEGEHPDVMVEADIETLLDRVEASVVMIATDSFTKKSYDKIETVLKRGINVISTAEEMAYPKANEPELAEKMDALAKANHATILGTGINPGFVMDLLVVAMSGVMSEVESIQATRVNSLSPFGPTVMEEQGVGISPETFEKRLAEGSLSGHVGFKESVMMIADALGAPIDRFEQQMKPIMTSIDRKSKYGEAKAGNLAGIDMTAQGYQGDNVFIDMKHPQQIEPELEGTQTGDYITIKGTPEINLSVKPEIDGGIGTIAMCVNMIPHVLNASPGLKTMIDLPVPRAILGDMRDLLD